MGVLQRLARFLEQEDRPPNADAIVALDGGDDPSRRIAAFDLLRRGVAPRLLVSRSIFGEPGPAARGAEWADAPGHVFWVVSDAISTRDEAIEARRVLKRLNCSSVLVVTSCYHTRRAKMVFLRELARDGIRVGVVPAPVPDFDPRRWWKSQEGRAMVLFEYVKLLCTWMHLNPPIPSGLRVRLKDWVFRTIP